MTAIRDDCRKGRIFGSSLQIFPFLKGNATTSVSIFEASLYIFEKKNQCREIIHTYTHMHTHKKRQVKKKRNPM